MSEVWQQVVFNCSLTLLNLQFLISGGGVDYWLKWSLFVIPMPNMFLIAFCCFSFTSVYLLHNIFHISIRKKHFLTVFSHGSAYPWMYLRSDSTEVYFRRESNDRRWITAWEESELEGGGGSIFSSSGIACPYLNENFRPPYKVRRVLHLAMGKKIFLARFFPLQSEIINISPLVFLYTWLSIKNAFISFMYLSKKNILCRARFRASLSLHL